MELSLNVFFTIDVELWPQPLQSSENEFQHVFDDYINGATAKGNYGLPFQLRVLEDHGMVATCFVEPLFSYVYGVKPLQDIVHMIQKTRSEVQLHLHTEWNSVENLELPLIQGKIGQNMSNFTYEEQNLFIQKGLTQLKKAGAKEIKAFRAGNYGANSTTLQALAANNINIDSSYNYLYRIYEKPIGKGSIYTHPLYEWGVYEYPISIFRDRSKHYRHAQLCACSFGEIKYLLLQAWSKGWNNIVLVSHSFELLNRKTMLQSNLSHDPIVTRRFIKLCHFLDKHRDKFVAKGLSSAQMKSFDKQPNPIASNILRTSWRYCEQLIRKF